MSAPEPTLTLEQAQTRLAELERQLAEIVPQLQAEMLYLRGWVAAKTQDEPAVTEPTSLPARAARRKKTTP
jgi:hypothetical protein